MKIAIIGAGQIGGILAKRYAASGHDVTIATARNPEALRERAEELAVKAATLDAAVAGAEVVIISIPQMAIPKLPAGLFETCSSDLVVVDTGNYMPFRDPPIEAIENGMVESVWVAQQLGHPIVKAYNSIVAHSLQNKNLPADAPGRIALPVAGDDARAKQIVMQLVDLSGFDPFDAGTLEESWRQQPGMAAYCTDLTLEELPAALARANRAAGPRIRDAFAKKLLESWDRTTPAERTAIIRSFHKVAN